MPTFPLLGGAADSFATVLIHKLGQLMEQACSFDAQRYCLAVRENSVRLHADGVRARSALWLFDSCACIDGCFSIGVCYLPSAGAVSSQTLNLYHERPLILHQDCRRQTLTFKPVVVQVWSLVADWKDDACIKTQQRGHTLFWDKCFWLNLIFMLLAIRCKGQSSLDIYIRNAVSGHQVGNITP